ncbi:sensor histidine kinase [Nocardiopsis ansamitocini]|uniref:histidine kinase n=1 Tax=Nocardiopsis ansamitocini TaxID=1670832 RepID=A0A9W6P960_9ACTN|nr:HAMP domain-containing sensor histidine kinase [Nocardiopsis ansamitocini]GLU49904.1 two-component sensor histidine kinase [Nocardiopsis ansamitocini]
MRRPHGLRGRLVLAVLALTAACLVAFSLVGVVLLQRSLLDDIDGRLRELARPVAMGPPPDTPEQVPGPRAPTDYRIVALDEAGDVLWSTGQGQGDTGDPDLGGVDGADVGGDPFTLDDVAGGSDWRAIAMRTTDGETIVVARSLASIDDTLTRLLLIECVMGVLLLAALGAGAVAIVRIQLRPLERIERTAEAIAAGALDERITDPDPRTETGRLAASINTMLAELARALDERSRSEARMRRFVADASHELRTPLASIRGFAELHRQSRSAGAPPDGGGVDRWMERIESEASRMGRLVDDLLFLARFDEEPDLRADDVELAGITREAVADARARAPHTVLELDAPSAIRLVGDELRLRQVLVNLIGNSLVHTPPGTPVRVSVRRSGIRAPEPGAVVSGRLPAGTRTVAVLTVRDEGPGIPAGAAAHAFDRFYRVDAARSRAAGGAGLGLAISAVIVTAHEGRVELVSREGRGTSVTVLLPLE